MPKDMEKKYINTADTMKPERIQPHSPMAMCLNVSFNLFRQTDHDIFTV